MEKDQCCSSSFKGRRHGCGRGDCSTRRSRPVDGSSRSPVLNVMDEDAAYSNSKTVFIVSVSCVKRPHTHTNISRRARMSEMG